MPLYSSDFNLQWELSIWDIIMEEMVEITNDHSEGRNLVELKSVLIICHMAVYDTDIPDVFFLICLISYNSQRIGAQLLK